MLHPGQELKKVPFIKLVIPFIVGIILELVLKAGNEICLFFFFSVSAFFLFISLLRIHKSFSYGFLWGIAVNLFMFSLGVFLTLIRLDNLNPPVDFANSKIIVTEVNDIPVNTPKGLKVPVTVSYFRVKNGWKKCKEKCNLYIEADSLNIAPGNILLIKTKPQQIDFPVSPYQFDFKTYLYYKGTLFSIYANPKNIIKLELPEKLTLSLFSLKIRGYLLDKLNNGGINKKQNPVLSALLLGYCGNIDPDVRNSYAVAGVMHILSVSGMHVGIVYLFLLFLLFFMEKNKYLKVLRTIIVICGLWFYALITGFSPPVIRAATMFSFLAAGQALNRNTNQFNTLAASAFFMLILNPLQITDLGFQLSYAALTGIFLFYKPLYESWAPSSFILDKTWALVALSISAQAGTLPLSLFYFHQFPTYFIITNIVIVPLTGIIIYIGLGFLVLSFWPFATIVLAAVLNFLLNILDLSVSSVEYLPMASITGIYISLLETLMLAIMILIIALWTKTLNKNLVFAFLSVSLIFTASISFRHISQINQKVLIVHNAENRTAISIIHGHKWLLIADSSIRAKIEFASSNMISKYGIREKHFLNFEKKIADTVICNTLIHPFAKRNFFTVFNNKKILIIHDGIYFKADSLTMKLDYVVNLKEKICSFNNQFASPVLITYTKNNGTNMSFKKNKIYSRCFFINEQGSFKEDL